MELWGMGGTVLTTERALLGAFWGAFAHVSVAWLQNAEKLGILMCPVPPRGGVVMFVVVGAAGARKGGISHHGQAGGQARPRGVRACHIFRRSSSHGDVGVMMRIMNDDGDDNDGDEDAKDEDVLIALPPLLLLKTDENSTEALASPERGPSVWHSPRIYIFMCRRISVSSTDLRLF